MKVLMINGSPHAKGNTYTALAEMEKVFSQEGIETEIVHVGNKDIRGCIACYSCSDKGRCVFDDLVNETAPKPPMPCTPGTTINETVRAQGC